MASAALSGSSAKSQHVWERDGGRRTVDNVQEDKLRPQVRLLGSSNDLRLRVVSLASHSEKGDVRC